MKLKLKKLENNS